MYINVETLKNSNDFLNLLYNNINYALFIANEEPRIFHFNNTMKTLFNRDDRDILHQLCGNAMNCINAVTEKKDCGDTSHCQTCPLRAVILESMSAGRPVIRKTMDRTFLIDNERVEKTILVNSNPVVFEKKNMIFISIEDISEIEEKRKTLLSQNIKLRNLVKQQTGELITQARLTHHHKKDQEEIIQELQHRMGNILQIISSITHIQFQETEAEDYSRNIQNHLQNIRILYDHLNYKDLEPRVDLYNYLTDLLYQQQEQNLQITLNLNITQQRIAIDSALPLGILFQEIIDHCRKNYRTRQLLGISGNNCDPSRFRFEIKRIDKDTGTAFNYCSGPVSLIGQACMEQLDETIEFI